MKRDFPNKPQIYASPRDNAEKKYQQQQRQRIEEQKKRGFDKMLARGRGTDPQQPGPSQASQVCTVNPHLSRHLCSQADCPDNCISG